MSDDRKRKPSVWRIVLVVVILIGIGYLIYCAV